MPAKSSDQKKFMQLALAVKKGEKDKSEVSQDVVDAAESMSTSELEKYAKGDVEEKLHRIVREEVRNVLKEDHLSENQLGQLDGAVTRLDKAISRVESSGQNVNMMYGDGGKYSQWVSDFVDGLFSRNAENYENIKELKRKLYDEYPDYDWSFIKPEDTSWV